MQVLRLGPNGIFQKPEKETHPLDLNIKHINLPAITDSEIVKAYDNLFTTDSQAREAATESRLVEYLMDHPMYAAFGFHKGFGTVVFNQLVQSAYLKSGKDMEKFY